jgi:AbrB family looped-hinge helix DNA binding protein
MLSRMTSKGQVTIPVEVRRRWGIEPHDEVMFIMLGNEVSLIPVKRVAEFTAGAFRADEPVELTREQQEKRWIEDAIGEEVEREGLPKRRRGKL